MNFNDVLDGMLDWVRVVDVNNTILYVNKAMAEGAVKSTPAGMKCYEAIGRGSPCSNCISRNAVFSGMPFEKEEIIGDRIFSIKSSPVRNSDGNIFAAVEVLRDVTEVKKLQKNIEAQNKKLHADLDLAKKLQFSLLPKQSISDKIDFGYVYKPCELLGGDFLDMFKIDETHIGIYIADVSGHGVTASMLTVFLRSTFDKCTLSPSQALIHLHSEFNRSGFDPLLYITVFYVIIDIETRLLTYSNAGHHALPIVFSENRYMSLFSQGTPISNWVDAPEYTEATMELNAEDSILFLTDGVIETVNEDGISFGEESLKLVLQKPSTTSAEVVQRLVDAVSNYSSKISSKEQDDDITIAVLSFKESYVQNSAKPLPVPDLSVQRNL